MGNEEKSANIDLNLTLVKKIHLEWILLLFFIISLLSFASIFNAGKLIHQSPYQMIAGDMFTFMAYSEAFKEITNINQKPPYMSAGYTDVPIFFSPLPGILTAQLSDFTGVETYDIIMHYNLLLIIAVIFIIYFLVRQVNLYMALLSLPITLIIFKWPFTYYMNWGMHLSNFNIFFVAGSLFAFLYLKQKWMFIVLGIINVSGFLSHGREFQTVNLAFVAFLAIQAIYAKLDIHKIDWLQIKLYFLSLIITLIGMFRYLPVFFDYGHSSAVNSFWDMIKFCPIPESSAYHGVYISTYGIFQWLLIIGLMFLIASMIFRRKENRALLLVSVYVLLFIISSYFCIYGNKTTQIRHLSPLFVMPLIGIALVYILSPLKRVLREYSLQIFTFILMAVMLAILFKSFYPTPSPEYPVSNPYTWEAITWARDNIDRNKNILVFMGDNHYQDTLFYSMKHVFYMADKEPEQKTDFSNKIIARNLTPEHLLNIHIVHLHYHRESFFNLTVLKPIQAGYPEPELDKTFHGDICKYDYVYTNKISQDSGRQKYAQAIVEALINEARYTKVFENPLVIILRNNHDGCFKERKINI